MKLPMVSTAKWYGEVIAHLKTDCSRLRKAQMMRIGGLTRHGCEATNFRCALSRRRLGSAIASWLLSILAGVSAGGQTSEAAPPHCLLLRLLDHAGAARSKTLDVAARSSATDAGSASCRRDANRDEGALLPLKAAAWVNAQGHAACPCGKAQGQRAYRMLQGPAWWRPFQPL